MPAAHQAASSDLVLGRVAYLVRLAQSTGEGVDELLALLAEPRWVVRREVIAALAALGDLALAPLYRSLQNDRGDETRIAATVDTLVASSGHVEHALVGLPPSDNPALFADVAQILGRRRRPESVPLLIAFLRHDNDNVAVAAIEALGRIGGRAAVEALVDAVDRDYFFRTYPAIDVLGRSGDPRAVAPLARLLGKPQYVLEAARALGRTADKRAVSPLCELLVSSIDTHVRVAALALAELADKHRELYGSDAPVREILRVTATESAARRVSQAFSGADGAERVAMCVVLGALQNQAAAPALVRMLDGTAAVASAATAALRQLGRDADEQLRAALVAGDSARRQILLPLFPESGGTGEVLRCLDDPEPAVRALACDALARMGDQSVVARLFELLHESNPRVLQAATGAIQSLGSAQTAALAIGAARSPSPATRRAGLRILAYFGCAAAIDVFSEAVHDEDVRVRDVAITGLSALEHPQARALLLRAALAGADRVRAAAMRGLGQSSAEADVIAALHKGLGDPDAWVRYYACQALGKLRVDDAAVSVAVLLADSAGQVRVAAVEALAHLKSAAALDGLRRAVASDEPDLRRAALIGLGLIRNEEALPLLIAACDAPEAATRLVVLSALSGFMRPETLPVVARAMFDRDEGVRAAAVGVLSGWPDREATRLLIDAMKSDDVRAAILRALTTPARGRIEGLLSALETADDELAPVLTAVLGRVDEAEGDGNDALLVALRLPNPAARKAAAAMLAAKGSRVAIDALVRQSTEDLSEEVRRVCSLLLAQ